MLNDSVARVGGSRASTLPELSRWCAPPRAGWRRPPRTRRPTRGRDRPRPRRPGVGPGSSRVGDWLGRLDPEVRRGGRAEPLAAARGRRWLGADDAGPAAPSAGRVRARRRADGGRHRRARRRADVGAWASGRRSAPSRSTRRADERGGRRVAGPDGGDRLPHGLGHDRGEVRLACQRGDSSTATPQRGDRVDGGGRRRSTPDRGQLGDERGVPVCGWTATRSAARARAAPRGSAAGRARPGPG